MEWYQSGIPLRLAPLMQQSVINTSTYHWDHAAGPDAIAHTHSHEALVVWILAPPH